MRNNIARPTKKEALAAVQRYQSSLECLMDMGRVLIAQPSMESTAADSYQVLVENVMEEAEQQSAVAEAVGEVTEPAAKVELIMEHVVQPHIEKASVIEEKLAEQIEEDNDDEEFITSDQATSDSLESLQADLNELTNTGILIGAFREVISLEGLDVEQVRGPVERVLGIFQAYHEGLGVSLESEGETQVMGKFVDAVQQIEDLVGKATEKAQEEVEAARAGATAIGGDAEDKIGDAIDQHREENPSGGQLDEGTNVSSVPSDEVDKEMNLENDETGEDGAHREDEEESEESEESEEEEESSEEEVDDSEEESEEESDDTDSDEEEETEEESEEESDDNDEEEDVSTESHCEPVEFSLPEENTDTARHFQVLTLKWMSERGYLSEVGQSMVEGAESNPEFILRSDMMIPGVADVLCRHYDVWMNASIRDEGPNFTALETLINS